MSQSEVDHDQGTVGFPPGEVGLDRLQGFLHGHEKKLFHLGDQKHADIRKKKKRTTKNSKTRSMAVGNLDKHTHE